MKSPVARVNGGGMHNIFYCETAKEVFAVLKKRSQNGFTIRITDNYYPASVQIKSVCGFVGIAQIARPSILKMYYQMYVCALIILSLALFRCCA